MSLSESDARAQAQRRNIGLLFDGELSSGALNAESPQGPALRRAVRVSRVPSRPWRVVQQLRYKRGAIDFERTVSKALHAARREVLGPSTAAPPKFLVRVDEFPHYMALEDPAQFGTPSFERFHEIMLNAAMPYLIAVLPRVSREPLSPSSIGSRPLDDDEVMMLRRLAQERVSFGLHGLDHRTRFVSARSRSELSGLTPGQTERLLDQGLDELLAHRIRPEVFVPPFNRFDAAQFELLAQRFDVICGGPESIGTMGFQSAPQWRGEAVYLPSYAPFYGHACEVHPAAERAIEQAAGLWTPIVLHWGWEAQASWRDLERLVTLIAPYTARWEDFQSAMKRSR